MKYNNTIFTKFLVKLQKQKPSCVKITVEKHNIQDSPSKMICILYALAS